MISFQWFLQDTRALQGLKFYPAFFYYFEIKLSGNSISPVHDKANIFKFLSMQIFFSGFLIIKGHSAPFKNSINSAFMPKRRNELVHFRNFDFILFFFYSSLNSSNEGSNVQIEALLKKRKLIGLKITSSCTRHMRFDR